MSEWRFCFNCGIGTQWMPKIGTTGYCSKCGIGDPVPKPPVEKLTWTEADMAIASGGTKHDSEKIRMELLSAHWVEGVGRVLTFGAKKYDAHNWRKGISFSRLLGAAFRHLYAILRGEDNDPETGLSHWLHLSCCCMFAYEMTLTRPDLDDRYKVEVKQ